MFLQTHLNGLMTVSLFKYPQPWRAPLRHTIDKNIAGCRRMDGVSLAALTTQGFRNLGVAEIRAQPACLNSRSAGCGERWTRRWASPPPLSPRISIPWTTRSCRCPTPGFLGLCLRLWGVLAAGGFCGAWTGIHSAPGAGGMHPGIQTACSGAGHALGITKKAWCGELDCMDHSVSKRID